MKNRRNIVPLAFLLFTSAAALDTSASDWPQWRGPNRDGISTETGLLKAWPAGGPQLAWKTTGLGAGYSGMAVVGNRIFTVGDRSGASFVTALNAADGKQVWSAKFGQAGAPGWGGYEGPRSTPTFDADLRATNAERSLLPRADTGPLLFAIGQYGDIAGFETTTGKERWHKDLVKDFGGTKPEWGFAESPLVDGEKVVFTPGGAKGAILAVNKNTGETIWQTRDFKDLAHYSSLIVAEIGGVRQYIQLTAASVVGISATDGKLLWRAARRGEVAVIPTPIYFENHVYVTSGYGIGCNLFRIEGQGGIFSAKQVYANKVMVNHHGGVVKFGENVYGYSDGKGWTCQNFKTGQAVWQDKEHLDKGSLTCADGRLYLRLEEGAGTVALIEPTPTGYKEHGRFNQPDRTDKNSWTHPVIANGKLYIRDQDLLLCYDIKAK
jgi:outer membrane protein assembly factor BamB